MLHEIMAICKSQLEAIIENPGNAWGEGVGNKLLVAGSQTDYTGISFVCNTGYDKTGSVILLTPSPRTLVEYEG